MKSGLIYLLFVLLLLGSSSCGVHKLCPIPGCQVRMLHSHNGVTFRGQPWWRMKKQNPKVGQHYVYTKDRNLIEKEYWWSRKKKKEDDKKTSSLPGIKARDPRDRKQDKDLEVEEPEEDKDEKEGN